MGELCNNSIFFLHSELNIFVCIGGGVGGSAIPAFNIRVSLGFKANESRRIRLAYVVYRYFQSYIFGEVGKILGAVLLPPAVSTERYLCGVFRFTYSGNLDF